MTPNLSRSRHLGTSFALLVASASLFISCGESTGIANGITVGFWSGIEINPGWSVCFFVSSDGTQLVPDPSCGEPGEWSFGYEVQDGTTPNATPCLFTFKYPDPITIGSGGAFAVNDWQPSPTGPTFSFSGTVLEATASGTGTAVDAAFNGGSCTNDWTAMPSVP